MITFLFFSELPLLLSTFFLRLLFLDHPMSVTLFTQAKRKKQPGTRPRSSAGGKRAQEKWTYHLTKAKQEEAKEFLAYTGAQNVRPSSDGNNLCGPKHYCGTHRGRLFQYI
jgi:hypothetical protein